MSSSSGLRLNSSRSPRICNYTAKIDHMNPGQPIFLLIEAKSPAGSRYLVISPAGSRYLVTISADGESP